MQAENTRHNKFYAYVCLELDICFSYALPFVIGIGSGYLNAYFKAMNGFTTTGITVYCGLNNMPRSILCE
ncbi:MAG: hypothetical protein KAI59_04675 [Planctomycetes bacterium]|nr:hypothetical protein [Planctomycetota bacterium]MCK5473304.1 hypothetical protein [Planctomycetota bacterium]